MTKSHTLDDLSVAIIVAAGRSARMQTRTNGPKQYFKLGKTSILQRTIDQFIACNMVDKILVVIHPEDENLYQQAVSAHPKLLPTCFGGKTRQASCFAGLKAIEPLKPLKVLIHDAARPFISAENISDILQNCKSGQCTLPAISVADTVKKAEVSQNGLKVTQTIPREDLYLAQTPQGFIFEEILKAHTFAAENEACKSVEFTDDAAVGELTGLDIIITKGDQKNIKITTPEDIENAIEMINSNQKQVPDVRTGSGYDIHRLIPGDGTIILCGLEIASPLKLDGHSDADVGLHALTDALLGTISAGDIGSHFPPSDPQWQGVSSDRFLNHACKLVREKSGLITHLDVTLICEAPKLEPHKSQMRAKIAEICNLSKDQVSVKATTHERIGTLGRGEGIAALATATVVINS